jgi:hypothetical protein
MGVVVNIRAGDQRVGLPRAQVGQANMSNSMRSCSAEPRFARFEICVLRMGAEDFGSHQFSLSFFFYKT